MSPGDRVVVDSAPDDHATITNRPATPPQWSRTPDEEHAEIQFDTGCFAKVGISRLRLEDLDGEDAGYVPPASHEQRGGGGVISSGR
jgi:hypothetical protein